MILPAHLGAFFPSPCFPSRNSTLDQLPAVDWYLRPKSHGFTGAPPRFGQGQYGPRFSYDSLTSSSPSLNLISWFNEIAPKRTPNARDRLRRQCLHHRPRDPSLRACLRRITSSCALRCPPSPPSAELYGRLRYSNKNALLWIKHTPDACWPYVAESNSKATCSFIAR